MKREKQSIFLFVNGSPGIKLNFSSQASLDLYRDRFIVAKLIGLLVYFANIWPFGYSATYAHDIVKIEIKNNQ